MPFLVQQNKHPSNGFVYFIFFFKLKHIKVHKHTFSITHVSTRRSTYLQEIHKHHWSSLYYVHNIYKNRSVHVYWRFPVSISNKTSKKNMIMNYTSQTKINFKNNRRKDVRSLIFFCHRRRTVSGMASLSRLCRPSKINANNFFFFG